MRVITGTARGRKLAAPPGFDTRPTSELVKEAVFSMIQFDVEGARVLDLFAGSGQMGIEALSRGAHSCVFVDNAKAAHQALAENLGSTGFSSSARVVRSDALTFLQSTKGPFDIAFLDPPYQQVPLASILPILAENMRESGIILCETGAREDTPESAGLFVKYREYRYGKTKITQYRHPQEHGGE